MAFAIPRFNAQPGQSGPLAPRMDPGEAAAGGLMLARAGRQAMDASVEIQQQAQGMRRMEALAGSGEHFAEADAEFHRLLFEPLNNLGAVQRVFVPRSAYNRAQYMDIRRPMLQAWADWLLPPPKA